MGGRVVLFEGWICYAYVIFVWSYSRREEASANLLPQEFSKRHSNRGKPKKQLG